MYNYGVINIRIKIRMKTTIIAYIGAVIAGTCAAHMIKFFFAYTYLLISASQMYLRFSLYICVDCFKSHTYVCIDIHWLVCVKIQNTQYQNVLSVMHTYDRRLITHTQTHLLNLMRAFMLLLRQQLKYTHAYSSWLVYHFLLYENTRNSFSSGLRAGSHQ